MDERIKVVIIDDHQIVRDGIKALLNDDNGLLIIAEGEGEQDLKEALKQNQTDVVIMDISIPGKSGVELCKEVTDNYPHVKVLILSMYLTEDFIFNSIKAGAMGYLPKNTSKKELVEAINQVHEGREYYSESVSEIMLKSYIKTIKEEDKHEDKLNALSNREIEILKLVAEGYTNAEAAHQLCISIRTVESHKNHIMQKLNLKSTVELIKYAIKNKLTHL